MRPALLTFNSGSSSLKFSLSCINDNELTRVFYGQVEILDEGLKFLVKNNLGKIFLEEFINFEKNTKFNSQKIALDTLLTWLKNKNLDYTICAAGHRVVHGGETFTAPIAISPQVLNQLESFIPLAPLHQPYNIAGIKSLIEFIPDFFQVACFDTAFHATQFNITQTYALPEGLSEIPIRRYGFHGLSYEYIAQVMPHCLKNIKLADRVIIAHLGHGASMCAMRNGKSIATTMGFTALDGLPMGTRCGNIDPGIILYLLDRGMSVAEITELLYKRSGLLGMSNISSDIRVLLSSPQPLAKKAIDVFIYRINRELGSLVAALGGLDSIIFTAGIGEHLPEIRARICEEATWLSILLDNNANRKNNLKISQDDSKISVWVIPTNEELVIAQHTLRLWKQHQDHENN